VDNDRWTAFLCGLLLGVLVTLGLVGTFGWSKYQQMRERAEEAETRYRFILKLRLNSGGGIMP
jgi:predicted negative regulator of RcsB-dependent stress response